MTIQDRANLRTMQLMKGMGSIGYDDGVVVLQEPSESGDISFESTTFEVQRLHPQTFLSRYLRFSIFPAAVLPILFSVQ